MSEVYGMFFIMLTIFLLTYTLRYKGGLNLKFLAIAAFMFGIAILSKYSSYQLIFLLMAIIIFRASPIEKLNLTLISNSYYG